MPLEEVHPDVLSSQSLHKLAKQADRIATALEIIATHMAKLANPPMTIGPDKIPVSGNF